MGPVLTDFFRPSSFYPSVRHTSLGLGAGPTTSGSQAPHPPLPARLPLPGRASPGSHGKGHFPPITHDLEAPGKLAGREGRGGRDVEVTQRKQIPRITKQGQGLEMSPRFWRHDPGASGGERAWLAPQE